MLKGAGRSHRRSTGACPLEVNNNVFREIR